MVEKWEGGISPPARLTFPPESLGVGDSFSGGGKEEKKGYSGDLSKTTQEE